MELKVYECRVCKEQFVIACLSQLQAKLKNHKCPNQVGNINKKRERSKQLEQDRIALYIHDIVVNGIEKHNFDRIIKQGIIVNA